MTRYDFTEDDDSLYWSQSGRAIRALQAEAGLCAKLVRINMIVKRKRAEEAHRDWQQCSRGA